MFDFKSRIKSSCKIESTCIRFNMNKTKMKYTYIYNIGVLTVNIEFMWRGLETGQRRSL